MYVSFNEALDNYLDFFKLRNKNSSYVSIKYRLFKYTIPFFDKKNIYDITKKDYLNWQIYINKLDLKHSYKSSLHYSFVSFLNYCVLFYDLECNVAKIVGNFKSFEIKKIGNIWSIDDFEKFISVVDSPIYHSLFRLLFFTGLRKGEALALTFNDFNLSDNKIIISKTITKECINGSRLITTPKTNSSYRTIYIPNSLVNEIYNLKQIYSSKYDNFNTNFFVFGGLKPFSFNTVMRKLNFYSDIAGVKRIKIHELRHSHACFLFQNDVPIDEISQRLGHSNISMTMKVYLNYLPKQEKRVIQTLNSY